jgi:hypothetical protein
VADSEKEKFLFLVAIMLIGGFVLIHLPDGLTGFVTKNTTNTTIDFDLALESVPVVTNVEVETTTSGATITWDTDVESDSQVEYGKTSSYGSSTALNNDKTTSHSVTISNLAAGTTYHYRILSANSEGFMEPTSDTTFETKTPAPTNPEITGSTYTLDEQTGIFKLYRDDKIQVKVSGKTYTITILDITPSKVTIKHVTTQDILNAGAVSLDFNADSVDELTIRTSQIVYPSATLTFELLAHPAEVAQPDQHIITTSGEELQVATDGSNNLIIDLEQTQEVVMSKRSSQALWWLLLVAVALGSLLSAYAYYHFHQRKILEVTSGNLLEDYVAMVRKMGFKNDQIKKALIEHGYTQEQAAEAVK